MKRAAAYVTKMMTAANKNRRTMTSMPAHPANPVARIAPLPLSPLETRIFDVLRAVVKDKNLGLTLRVAGGWVRDKLLLMEERTGCLSAAGSASADCAAGPEVVCDDDLNVDIDIALDNMMGEAFAKHVNSWLVEQGHEAASYGVTACNPDQSKHLATARMRVLGVWLDLVNLRTETYAQEDSRIPDVSIGTPFEDAMRRDLTINALFYNVNTGDIEDFTGNGVADLKARVVRTPLEPLVTLLDDPLRALRAIRFASRFNFACEPDLYTACQDASVHVALGAKVSRERVFIEIDQVVQSAGPIHALGLLVELGLFPVVFRLPPEEQFLDEARPPEDFPSAALGCLINLDRLTHHAVPQKDAFVNTRLARYAALLAPIARVACSHAGPGKRPKDNSLARYILHSELRMSSKDVDGVVTILKSSSKFKALVHRSTPQLDRLVVGRLLREAGVLWPIALQTALLTELSPAEVAETYASGVDEIPEALAKQSQVVVAAYATFRVEVDAMGLDGVWNMRPLVDGKELVKILPGLQRGPMMGKVMKKQVDYMMENRGVEVDAVREWIRSTFAEYAVVK